MDSLIEEESDSDYVDDQHSASETEDHESQTSDDDDEIDIEDHKLNNSSTRQSSYDSKSGIIWSSSPHHSSKTNSSDGNTITAGLTGVTANISSIEDAFFCFIPEKMLEKVLI